MTILNPWGIRKKIPNPGSLLVNPGELATMLKGDAKFKGKLTCSLKNDLRNLLNFQASSWKSGNLHFDGLLLSKAYKDLDKKYRRVLSHDTEERCKVWRKNWLLIPKLIWGIRWNLMWAVASLKIYTLMCSFYQ